MTDDLKPKPDLKRLVDLVLNTINPEFEDKIEKKADEILASFNFMEESNGQRALNDLAMMQTLEVAQRKIQKRHVEEVCDA